MIDGGRRIAIAIGLLLLMISGVGWGQPQPDGGDAWRPEPRLDWQELNAEHVRVLYTPDLAEAARLAAAAAERAYELWQERLGATPPATPTIVLSDRGDVPRSRIGIVPHPVIYLDHPVPQSSDGWTTLHGSGLVDQVMAHYGKLVDQTRVGDFSEDLRAVIGSVAVPGALKPLYLREGLTVRPERRADTALPEMVTRMWANAGAWPTLSELSAPHTDDHNGLAASAEAGALGRAWLDFLAAERSAPVDSAFSQLYADRPIVPLMADPLFAIIGRSSGPFYQRLIDARTPQTASAEPTGERLSPSGRSLDPTWAPDGTALVYRHETADRRPGLRLVTTDQGADRALIDGRIGGGAWGRIQTDRLDTGTLVYPRLRWTPDGRRVRDLVEYRIDTGQERRLTTDERIGRVAAFPQDPNRVLVARSEPGLGQSLVVMELVRTPQGEVREIVRRVVRTFGVETRVLDMAVAPNGERFALSLWQQGNGTDLVMIDRWGQTMTPIVTGPTETRDPAYSPDGRWLLYADDRSGVPQIYARRMDSGSTYRVTRAPGGAFDPDVSPAGDQLAFVRYGPDGYTIRTRPYDPDQWSLVPPAAHDQSTGHPASDGPASLSPDDVSIGPYRPGADLIPNFWMPLLVPSHVGIFTNNADPIGQHTYDVSFALQFAPLDLLYAFSYTNTHIYPALRIELRGTPAGAAETVEFTFPLQIDLNSARSMTLAWRHENGTNTFSLGGHLVDTSGIGRFERRSEVNVEGALIGAPQSPSHRLQLRWQEEIRLPLSSAAGAHRLVFDVQTAWSDTDEFRLGGAGGPYPVRGVPRGAAVGHQLARASLDYRFPVWSLDWACCGATPWPVFLKALSSSLFVDIGTAGDALEPEDAKLSAGVEFRLGVSLGYGLADGTLKAGLAYRFDTDSPELFVHVEPRF